MVNEEKKTLLFWVDTETTGFNVGGRLLEVAVVLTDLELNEVDAFESVIPQDDAFLSLMNDYVTEMHTKSGLIKDVQTCPEEGYQQELAKVENWIIKNMITPHEADYIFVIAGSTVSFDRGWLKKHMPTLESKLHYRQLDVSSYKVGFPEIFGTKTSDAHRAMSDIQASIELHRKMREIVYASAGR